MLTRKAVGITAAVLLITATAAGAVVVARRTGPSMTAFCAVLDGGYAELAANRVDPEADGFTQIVGALGELGRYEKLLDQLTDVAPDEIRYDMKKSRDTFNQSMDDSTGSAGDPIGALAKIFINSLIAGPSFEAIDRYAWTNCHKTVFGSPKQFDHSR